jgi:hypothetical protein
VLPAPTTHVVGAGNMLPTCLIPFFSTSTGGKDDDEIRANFITRLKEAYMGLREVALAEGWCDDGRIIVKGDMSTRAYACVQFDMEDIEVSGRVKSRFNEQLTVLIKMCTQSTSDVSPHRTIEYDPL